MRATPTTTPPYALMKNNYRRRLGLHTLEVLQTPSVGEVCEYPKVSSFSSIHILSWNWCMSSHLAPYEKKEKKKKRGIAMATTLSLHQQDTIVSALNVLLLTLNKALPGGRPRITRVSLLVRVKLSLNKF